MEASYRIMLTGIQFRKDRQHVKANLAKLFKCEPARIEQLLGQAPVQIKSGLGLEAALRYQQAIQDAGAECIVKPPDQ